MSTIYELAPSRKFSFPTGSPDLNEEMGGWQAIRVRVTNLTNQALYIPDADEVVPAGMAAVLAIQATNVARASYSIPAKFNLAQPAVIVGSAILTFTAEEIPPQVASPLSGFPPFPGSVVQTPNQLATGNPINQVFNIPAGAQLQIKGTRGIQGQACSVIVTGSQTGFVYFGPAVLVGTVVLTLQAADTSVSVVAGGNSGTVTITTLLNALVVTGATGPLLVAGNSPLPINAAGQVYLPVSQALRKATYNYDTAPTTTGALVANTDKPLLSIEHSAASVKTVRVKRITVSAVITTAGAAAGLIAFRVFRGTAASTGGTALTAVDNNTRVPAAECVVKSLPTIVTTNPPFDGQATWAPAAAGPLANQSVFQLYQWVPGEVEELVLRAGVLETLTVTVDAASTPTLTVFVTVELTEE